ncbi:hypothetical protein ACFOY4_04205 [Actinomadura syzygii]|uniref:Uncharacterized protein n=1 Tax=Actinomadura syzygii TaxID=1427538 RepID=A0A5D0TU85_9ACTN|nr:hypothetical protein [Actinomadura syzygii]TYC09911.1 hypothetical protein FXF65_32885 [Actinomadura syzygii]
MNRRTVLAPATLLAAVLLALVAMVGAYAPQSHAAGPTARIGQSTTTLGTTSQAAAASDFVIKSFACSSKVQEGKNIIFCKAEWTGGKGPFTPKFKVNLTFFDPVLRFWNETRTAEYTFRCLGGMEYVVTLSIGDIDGSETPKQGRYVVCGNQ